MSVIKEEYMADAVTQHDLLPLSFLKKSDYTGSRGILRYKIGKYEETVGEETEKKLRVFTWKTPLAFDKTPDEEKEIRDFPFEEGSLLMIAAYLNTLYRETAEK